MLRADQIDIKQTSNLLQLMIDRDHLLVAGSQAFCTHSKLPSTTQLTQISSLFDSL